MGRIVVIEILETNADIRDAIMRQDKKMINKLVRAAGFQSMMEHAIEKVLQGETTIKEMLARVPSGY